MCPIAGIFLEKFKIDRVYFSPTKKLGLLSYTKGDRARCSNFLIITPLEMRVARRIWFTILRNGAFRKGSEIGGQKATMP